MVKHIIIWELNDELSAEQRQEAKARIKNGLESLKGVIDGLTEISVKTELLPTSAGDLMLDSTFTDEAALAAYAVHPAHVAVKEYVATVVKSRRCADYIII